MPSKLFLSDAINIHGKKIYKLLTEAQWRKHKYKNIVLKNEDPS